MMAECSYEDSEKWRQVIARSIIRLKKNLIPDPILDCSTGFELFSIIDKRDIKEKVTTTEKIHDILTKVRSKGIAGYEDFKERLTRTHQIKLVDFLDCMEKELDTNEIERELDEIADKPWPSTQYFTLKKELKDKLIKFYKSKRSTVSLSPLIEEIETPLAGFYVMPDMFSVKQTTFISDQMERTPVSSLTDFFITGCKGQKEIYLSADAGFGKTAFSKYLAITWCQGFCQDKSQKSYFKDDELKALSTFEFLFLVLLRDSTAVCTIDEMIEQQIIKKLPPSASRYPLQEILDREKCLIILDGLDEWTHPDNGCSDKKEKIPHRYARDNCVILTTTRPWKLGVSNLKTSDIDKKIELLQLSKDSTRQLEKNAIGKMSCVIDDDELKRKTSDFNKVIDGRGLEHMQTIPLLLMYIVCLWCNKIPLGNSKLEVYINIIEFLLSRTARKHPEVHPSSDTSDSYIPEYLKGHRFCQKFYSLLTALARLAYHTLFNEKRENTLVFDGSVADSYLNVVDMKSCLLSGILTESTTTTSAERTSKVSFSHKTVQEFFAAIFISSQSDAQKIVLEKCKTIQSILDISMICEFLSKMNSKMMCEISVGFMSVINRDEETRRYRTGIDLYLSYALYNIQRMLVSCLIEMPEGEDIKLCLQDFFMNNDDTIHDTHLQRLSKHNKANMKSLYICTRLSSSDLREIVELFSLTDLNNLLKLCYDGYYEDADISQLLLSCLKTVRLSSTTRINCEGNFCDKITNVQYLYISSLSLSHEMLETLFNFISGAKKMKEFKLGNVSCNEKHRRSYKRTCDLSKHSQLKKLVFWSLPPLKINVTTPSLSYVNLRYINLGENSILLSRDMLDIERVELWYIKIPASSFDNFIKLLEDLEQSVTVEMNKCDVKPETEYESVRNYIRSSQTFVVTYDYDDWQRKFVFQTRSKY